LTRGKNVDELPAPVAALRAARLPAFLLERSGRVLWHNDRLGGLWRVAVGRTLAESGLVGSPAVGDALTAIMTSGEPCEFSMAVAWPDGSERTLQFSVVPVEGRCALVGVFGLDGALRSSD
jgi:hypothetical protein